MSLVFEPPVVQQATAVPQPVPPAAAPEPPSPEEPPPEPPQPEAAAVPLPEPVEAAPAPAAEPTSEPVAPAPPIVQPPPPVPHSKPPPKQFAVRPQVAKPMPQRPAPAPTPPAEPAPSIPGPPVDASAPQAESPVSVAWNTLFSAWLAARKTYPEAARRHGEQGNVTLRFKVAVDGKVVDVALVTGSGSPVLDQAAEALLQNATLPAPHAEISRTVRLRYRLDD
jgi:protein TonB